MMIGVWEGTRIEGNYLWGNAKKTSILAYYINASSTN